MMISHPTITVNSPELKNPNEPQTAPTPRVAPPLITSPDNPAQTATAPSPPNPLRDAAIEYTRFDWSVMPGQ